MSQTRQEKIQAVRNWLPYLKKQFPLGKPVRIVFINNLNKGDEHGNCDLTSTGKSFVIKLGLRNDIANLIQWLMHEWTHARVWHLHPSNSDHPPEWGVQYARIWEYCIDHDCTDPVVVGGNSEPGG